MSSDYFVILAGPDLLCQFVRVSCGGSGFHLAIF